MVLIHAFNVAAVTPNEAPCSLHKRVATVTGGVTAGWNDRWNSLDSIVKSTCIGGWGVDRVIYRDKWLYNRVCI